MAWEEMKDCVFVISSVDDEGGKTSMLSCGDAVCVCVHNFTRIIFNMSSDIYVSSSINLLADNCRL